MASVRRSVIVSVLFLVLGGPAFALVYIPLWITRFRLPPGEPVWQILLAAGLMFTGISPALESVRRFIVVGRGTLLPVVPTEHLVISGFYRYVRNPMYVGVIITLSGEVLLFRSHSLLEFACLLWLGFHLFVCLYEERTLTRRYGEEYRVFLRNVPRWLPRVTPWYGDPARVTTTRV
jgi:protein-S-isoprenylcysteine O-methyltransferase Ste14